jgi:hypothetical protein
MHVWGSVAVAEVFGVVEAGSLIEGSTDARTADPVWAVHGLRSIARGGVWCRLHGRWWWWHGDGYSPAARVEGWADLGSGVAPWVAGVRDGVVQECLGLHDEAGHGE